MKEIYVEIYCEECKIKTSLSELVRYYTQNSIYEPTSKFTICEKCINKQILQEQNQ